jgi:predicted metal-binding protein
VIREGGAGRRPASQETCRRDLKSHCPAGDPGEELYDVTVDPPATTESGPADAVTIIVCSSCRDESGSDARPRPGELLGAATRAAAAGTDVVVRQVECLGNCKRRLSAAMLRHGCWSYVFGDLTPENGPDLIEGATLFAKSTDGLLPWRGRPDCLKRGLVARIPPIPILEDPS